MTDKGRLHHRRRRASSVAPWPAASSSDNKVIVFDNFSRDALRDKPFKDHPNLTLIKGDILDLDGLREAMAGRDLVVHCAAIAGIDTVIVSPVNDHAHQHGRLRQRAGGRAPG